MTAPDLVNQLTAGGQFPHEDCGEACVLSVLVDAGKVTTVADIEQFDLTHGDSPADGTGGGVHVQRLVAAGLGAHIMTGDSKTNILDGITKGHDRWMVAIWSDHYGDPSPGSGIGHWVLCYGYDAASDTFLFMNPLGGRLVTITAQDMAACQQEYGVAVETFIGKPAQPVNNGAIINMKVDSPVIGAAATPNGGLWLLTQSGAVYALGGARYHGGVNPGSGITPIGSPKTITAFGDGYIIATDQGRTYAFNCPDIAGADETPNWAH